MHNSLLRRKRQHDSNPLRDRGILDIKPDCPNTPFGPLGDLFK
jgi:hypothetical protein